MSSLPLVSCVVAAYNYGDFVERAVRSALDQDYPPEGLEIIVVDDGSTDDTAEKLAALAAQAPDRIRVFSQPNGGHVSALNHAIDAARGSLLAVLDADDMWPADKTRAQVDLFAARPEVGLVYTDMTVVDRDDAVVDPSFFDRYGVQPVEGRPISSLLVRGNSATASSIMFRASLLPLVFPIPDEIPYADWWLAVRAAQAAELACLRTPRTLYRLHGQNLTFGAAGEQEAREQRKFTTFRRQLLRYIGPGDGTPRELIEVCEWIRDSARWVSRQLDLPWQELVPVTYEERRAATELAAAGRRAARDGRPDEAAARFANALGHALDSEAALEGIGELKRSLATSPTGSAAAS